MEDICRTKDIAEQALRDALGREGLRAGDIGAFVDYDHAGVAMRRKLIGRENRRDSDVGMSHPVLAKMSSGRTVASIHAVVQRFVDLAVALRRREEAIAAYVVDGAEPAWSVVMDRTALHLARHHGWSNEQLLDPRRTADGNYTAGRHGLTVGSGLKADTRDGCRVEHAQFGMGAGVLRMVRLDMTGARGAITYCAGKVNTLQLAKREVPLTMLSAFRGKAVDAVVGHPALEGCGGRISSASQTRVSDEALDLVLNLARDVIPMATPPDGVDTAWLKHLGRT